MSNDWHFLAYHSCRRIFCLVFMLIFLEVMHILRSCIHNFLASSIHYSHAYVDFLLHAYAAFLLHAYVAFLLHAYVQLSCFMHTLLSCSTATCIVSNLDNANLKGNAQCVHVLYKYCTVHCFIRTLNIFLDRYNSKIQLPK